jgi:hypothetical protein
LSGRADFSVVVYGHDAALGSDGFAGLHDEGDSGYFDY